MTPAKELAYQVWQTEEWSTVEMDPYLANGIAQIIIQARQEVIDEVSSVISYAIFVALCRSNK